MIEQFEGKLEISGIYCIYNKLDGKRYVGSSKHVYCRLREHNRSLIGNYHANSHLQYAWNKYGKEAFDCMILEIVDDMDKLIDIEQIYIDSLFCCDDRFGYNIVPRADRREVAPSTLEKLRQANIGKKISEETKRKLSLANKGRKLKGELLEKQLARNKELHSRPEYRQKLIELCKARATSKEVVEKIIHLYLTTKMTFNEIGEICDVSRPTIRKILRDNNVPYRGKINKGSKHYGWKGGIKNCRNCGKLLSCFKASRCLDCYRNRKKIECH